MKLKAKEITTRQLITISEQSPLQTAYSLMVRHGIRHLPVTTKGGGIVGILSDKDILRAMRSDVSGEGFFRRESCDLPEDLTAADYMNWPVKFVDKETSLRVLCRRMIEEKVSSFLVTDEQGVLGIVTSEDLLKLLEGLLQDPAQELKEGLAKILLHPTAGQVAQSLALAGI